MMAAKAKKERMMMNKVNLIKLMGEENTEDGITGLGNYLMD
jgi:hypothetical protein